MRIFLLADTHGVLDPRIAAAVDGADLLIHAGDVGAGVADQLASLAAEVLIVAGNNDPADCSWPGRITRALPGGQLAAMHGHQWPARVRHRELRAQFPNAMAVVCGHSHRRLVDKQAMPWLLNPGAAGKTRAYGGPGYIELVAGTDGWEVNMRTLEPLVGKRRPCIEL